MAGFRSLARQVRDPGSDLALRRYSLRKCLERFAPYGHRATWDHLCARHGIDPEDRAPDPVRLVRALEELERARAVWLGYEAGFAERRRREKHRGCAALPPSTTGTGAPGAATGSRAATIRRCTPRCRWPRCWAG